MLIDLFAGNICSRDILVELEKGEKIVNIDNDHVDPQLCASFACDIYKHLRASEVYSFTFYVNNYLIYCVYTFYA